MNKQNLENAKSLLEKLNNFNDSFSIKLKSVLRKFISDPLQNLVQSIEAIKKYSDGFRNLYNFEINSLLSDIYFPEN